MARDAENALDVIGKKMKTKDQIDLDFDTFEYKHANMEFIDEKSNEVGEKKSPTDEKNFSLKYKISSPYFGLNVLSNLNLGRAFKLVFNDEGDMYDYNISPDAKRARFPESEKFQMNEKWLRYVLGKISVARNSLVVIDDIFSRVTTGNFQTVLPYKEQFAYICSILDEYPEIINKTLAFARGPIANSIIANGGPDLMAKLAERYDCLDKLIDCEGEIQVQVKNNSPNNKISIRAFNPQTNGRTNFFKKMQDFAKTHPGYDVYYNTSARIDGMFDGMTSTTINGKTVEKPCTFICFGPMSEYDQYNAKRPSIGAYPLNRCWYKLAFEPDIVMGKKVEIVKPRFEDYTFPHKDKQDTSNYVNAVISNNIAEVLNSVANNYVATINKTIDVGVVPESRRELGKVFNKHKQASKRAEAKKAQQIEENKPKLEKKISLPPSTQEKIVPQKQKSKQKQTTLDDVVMEN